METKHLFENNIYLISNHAVARNPIFGSSKIQDYFITKMENYLDPLAQVIGYSLKAHEFKILVKLKSREEFESHFLEKPKKKKKRFETIPESTYIFSQAMANLQVSLVKHFNFINERSGTLMASRFQRKLVESHEEMEGIIIALNGAKNHHSYKGKWINDLMTDIKAITSAWLYTEREMKKVNNGFFINGLNIDLVGTFNNLPPYSLNQHNPHYFPPPNFQKQPFLA
jgi:hypothetical protein